MHTIIQAQRIFLEGLVQGVGFRPYVYRIAHRHDLKGWVQNTNEGVIIHAEGRAGQIADFREELMKHPPKASAIYAIKEEPGTPEYSTEFVIKKSGSLSDRITQVSPDIAVCDECLEDMKSQPHRLDYPFINCTHCGPRFSIIRDLPYDRRQTTMASFSMCDKCYREYNTTLDRRFHAQPVACHRCGPEYILMHDDRHVKGIHDILELTAKIIEEGGIIAIKGLGGFYLMCRADDDDAVSRLRNAKQRDHKPFAVMVRNPATAARYAEVSDTEVELLTSWRRPIVLLKQKKALAEDINPGCSTLGIMLPYMPFHHLLFEWLDCSTLVMTSGNLADEPIVTDNQAAQETFRDMADAILVYNRDIHNRVDDSVIFAAGGKQRIIRRSRGYVPEPIRLPFSVEGMLATGAELSHCFAVGKGHDAILSQHIGDLKDPSTYAFFNETVSRFCKLFRVEPASIACDTHPDYLSTRYAHQWPLPVIPVQHHHAHIAACMVEHGLNEPVAGVCWDGTGLGTDGHIWGGEFMHADLGSFRRHTHFTYLPLPGGDKAAVETWRMGISLLYQTMGSDLLNLNLPIIREFRKKPERALILQIIERQLNTPLTSSTGRLFDAVASIMGVCHYNTFHAEAPIKLEALIDEKVVEEYPFTVGKTIDVTPMIRSLITDLQNRVPLPVISTKFHNTLVSIIFSVAGDMKLHYHTEKVILTGGVFQNKYLLEQTETRLKDAFDVFSPQSVPSNDAGIALGQMAVAAHNKTEPDHPKLS